jgi:hypothetical protein
MSHVNGGTESDPAAARAVLELAKAYRVSQALYVATRLGVAGLLGDGPMSAEELARVAGAHGPSLRRLLRALAAFGVFDEVEPGRFALTAMGACLRADAADSMREAVLMWGSENMWRTWGGLLHCIETGESAMSHAFGTPNAFEYYAQHPEVGAVMQAGFTAQARGLAQAVAVAFDFQDGGTVVDVGGGRGLLLATILRAHPALRGVLFDQPDVVEGAVPLLEGAGVADRCGIVAGDMFAEVPAGGDTYVLSRVIHDWDDERAGAILRSCRRAMRPGASLLLVERVLPARVVPSATVQEQTLSDLNMLVRTGGHERTEGEFRALLGAAGFALERIIPTETTYSVVECVRGEGG